MKNKGMFLPAAKYSLFTPLFDFFCEAIGLGSEYRRKIIDVMGLKNEKFKVLDVGCGTGSLLIDIKRNYSNLEAHGIDPDKNILGNAAKKAEKNNVKIKFDCAYAQKLPFPSNYFDVALSSLAIHHIPSEYKQKALEEIHRVIKSKGFFMLVDFGKTKRFPIGAWLAATFEEGKENYEGLIPEMMKKAGFKQIKVMAEYKYGIQMIKCSK